MKKILVINTGGTIAMSVDASEGVKPLDDQAVVKNLPFLQRYADVTMVNFLNLPSPHITPAVMNDLRLFIQQELDQHGYDGVVVTHGTDFFQAEDGIRDDLVTGVQTCALPISPCEAATNWAQTARST